MKKTTKKTKEIKKIRKVKKAAKIKKVVKLKEIKEAPPREKYYEAVGRRKTAVARVRLFTKHPFGVAESFLVNKKPLSHYFPTPELQKTVASPLEIMKCLDKFQILTTVKGGGLSSQAEALRHGISRALTLFNPNFRKRLKKAGFLKRDPRMKERKKFGLKRARRAPQWQKR